jgi:hypothetical protein
MNTEGNDMNVNPNAATVIFEIQRLAAGGEPHPLDSAQGKALARALAACAAEAELAALATLGRKAFAAAAAELAARPLHNPFDAAPGTPKRKGARKP